MVEKQKKLHAVIMAGGLGTRMRPITLEMPKALLTVRKKPIINYLIDVFRKHGVTDHTVMIHRDHVGDFAWWKKQHAKVLPKGITLCKEPEPMGTFGGMTLVKNKLKDTFIVSNCDELKDFDVADMIREHKSNPDKPVATIGLARVSDPQFYGVPMMKGKKITTFLEKPKNPPTNFVSAGIYVLEPSVFNYADFSKGYLMIEKDIFPKLAAEGKLAGYKFKKGQWYDCGTPERWEKAIKEWKD